MTKYRVADFEYKLTICDHILDNIYGQIGLTEVEKKIERLSIFKRLHSLSQLGLVNWIFPCALHTRYTHSIGVMHIINAMAEHININMAEEFFCDSEVQILRLAGMLHDIGHYPLSHNIEHAYKDVANDSRYADETVSQNISHFVNCPKFLTPNYCENKPSDYEENKDFKLIEEEKFLKGFSGSLGFHHEYIGNLIIVNNEDIKKEIQEHFILLKKDGSFLLNPFFAPTDENGNPKREISEDELKEITNKVMIFIGNLVIGNYAFDEDMHYKWMEKYSAMIQLIHSDLDADNLDYLIRDATFSGTSYGTMDMGILLNCLYVKKFECEYLIPEEKHNQSESKISRYIVGITKKGVGAVEQFLLGKFMAYTQMILSKHVSILEAMLFKIESEIIIKNDKDYNLDELKKMVTDKETNIRYLNFSDHHILGKFFDMNAYSDNFKDLSKAIVSRMTHSSAFDLDDIPENECICIGTDEKEISETFKNNELYKNFEDFYNSIKDIKGGELNAKTESDLFSYRFERYVLTKQIPINEFEEKYMFDSMNEPKRFNFHYYRLANGIPIVNPLEDYSYYEVDKGKPKHEKIPALCVDSALSTLKDMHNLQFVSLRKYKICDYN